MVLQLIVELGKLNLDFYVFKVYNNKSYTVLSLPFVFKGGEMCSFKIYLLKVVIATRSQLFGIFWL